MKPHLESRSLLVRLPKRMPQGFSLVSAIFLLVVLAGLGIAMANFSTMQHTSSALDIQGARAYQAARAGIEWGLYRSLIPTSGQCPQGPTSFVPAAPTLSGFTVTVTCENRPFVTAAPQILVRHLTAVACNQPTNNQCPGTGGTVDYVERRVRVSF